MNALSHRRLGSGAHDRHDVCLIEEDIRITIILDMPCYEIDWNTSTMNFRQLSPGKPARTETKLMGPHIHNETDMTNCINPSFASLATLPDLVPSWTTVMTMYLRRLSGDDTRVQRQETSSPRTCRWNRSKDRNDVPIVSQEPNFISVYVSPRGEARAHGGMDCL